MKSTETLPVLYSFRRCPYAMRARMALLTSGTACELREIVLRAKPAEMLAVSPKGTVPVLLLPDGTVLEESLEIMLWALSRHDPHQWLNPEYASREAMLQLIAQCDGEFKFHLDRYKYPDRYENTDALTHRTAGAEFLLKLNGKLVAHMHLYGHRPTLADIAIAPFVRQFAHTDQAWFDAQPWPQLHLWLNAFQDSRLFNEAMRKYAPWEPGAPVQIFTPQ